MTNAFHQCFLLICTSFSVITFITATVLGHEGHQAVATRGITVEGNIIHLSNDVGKAIGLKTREVDFREMTVAIDATATIWVPPHQRAFASSRIAGKITEIKVRPGDSVKAGQPLAIIQSLEFENLQYQMIQAKQALEFVEQDRDRINDLVNRGILPKNRLASRRCRA